MLKQYDHLRLQCKYTINHTAYSWIRSKSINHIDDYDKLMIFFPLSKRFTFYILYTCWKWKRPLHMLKHVQLGIYILGHIGNKKKGMKSVCVIFFRKTLNFNGKFFVDSRKIRLINDSQLSDYLYMSQIFRSVCDALKFIRKTSWKVSHWLFFFKFLCCHQCTLLNVAHIVSSKWKTIIYFCRWNDKKKKVFTTLLSTYSGPYIVIDRYIHLVKLNFP